MRRTLELCQALLSLSHVLWGHVIVSCWLQGIPGGTYCPHFPLNASVSKVLYNTKVLRHVLKGLYCHWLQVCLQFVTIHFTCLNTVVLGSCCQNRNTDYVWSQVILLTSEYLHLFKDCHHTLIQMSCHPKFCMAIMFILFMLKRWNYVSDIDFSGMMFIPSLIKICQLVWKLFVGTELVQRIVFRSSSEVISLDQYIVLQVVSLNGRVAVPFQWCILTCLCCRGMEVCSCLCLNFPKC
jgi:hypothetical protein